ncbi:MAG: S9 family peptidase [Sphingomonadaceae bacterium]|nr:S9 family peptidase [Sphingomonadaceae bacterium]
MRRLLLVTLILAIQPLPLAAQEVTVPPRVAVRVQGSATLQNVPEIPAEIEEAVQRYQNYRAAEFEDWLTDGSMLITTRFGTTAQVHRVTAPMGARTQLTFFGEPVQAAEAIPGTNRFVLMRDTGGDEWFQLETMGLAGAPTRLTEPETRNQSMEFADGGELMLWARATRGAAAYTIMAADPDDPASRRELFRFEGSIEPSDISAGGTRALLSRDISNRQSEMYLLDIARGEATRFAPTDAVIRDENAHFARNGRSVLAISNRDSDFRRLVEFDVATGAMIVLTPGLEWDVEGYELSDDGRVLAYVINEDGFSRLVVQDFVTRRALPQPELPRGVITSLGFSPDGSKLAIGMTSATSPGDVWVWDVAGGGLTRWTQSELGPLDPATLVEPELIRYESFDGLSVPAFVYRPRDVAPGARTPVIIDIHGGPESQARPVWDSGVQYFVNTLGATVIRTNVRGSEGYGTRYVDLDNGPLREDSVRDVGALLDWIAAQPGLDPERVAVYGQSYGGYMSLASLVHYSDRLVGGVERYGISDFRSFLERTEAYRRDNRRGEYGDERDAEMAAVFARIAPMANTERITVPMLVMQGANDPRVPQFESDQIVERVRANGVPVWYVVFADEGHGFLKKPNNDLRRAVETLFLQRLFAGEEVGD